MNRQISPGTIVGAGIDWVTATFKPDFPNLGDIRGLAAVEQALAAERGETVKMMSPQGYTGVASDHIFFGAREDGYMLRLSSNTADRLYKELMCVDPSYRITRIDLQVSAKREKGEENFAPRIRAAIRAAETEARRKRQVKIATTEDPAGGNSVAIGSRTSECFIRIYDKSAEQRSLIEPDVTRYEAELKGDTARVVWRMIEKSRDSQKLSKSLLTGRLKKLGLDEPWMKGQRVVEIPTVYQRTDDERRLEYLSKHVKGIIDRLREAGLEAEARAALGLP